MSSSTTATLSDLLEETLAILYRANERPAQCTLGSDALSSTSDTSFTLAGTYTAVQATTVMEFGQELILVTDRTADAIPTFTGARGYAGSPRSTHLTGEVGLISPLWTRFEVRRAILRAFAGPLTTYLPNLTTSTVTTTANQYFASLPATTIEVFRVAVSQISGSSLSVWDEITQWDFHEDVPTSVVATGKMLTFPYGFPAGQALHVTYQTPYAWSGGTADPAETETVSIPSTALDLPALYAAACQVMGREITRLELDRIEEWNQEAAIRQGINLKIATAMWQEFYRRLDEAKRVQNIPRRRPYRKMRQQGMGRWVNGTVRGSNARRV